MGLSYAQGLGTTPLLGETIAANFDRAVATHGERDALVVRHQDVRMSYAELGEAVDRAARSLAALGLRKGDRAGIWAPNCAEWVVTQFATAKLGVILVNVNPAYRTTELAYAVRQSGCKALVSATEFKTSDYRAMIDEVRGDLPDLEHVLYIGEGLFEDAPGEVEWPELDPFEPINIQYTSGTTGSPKGATLSHSNILNNGYFVGEYCGYTEEDRVCIPVPFYHCFGMVMGNLACVSHGACMVVPAPSFEPEATLAAVAEERCTSLYGVPTMFIAELEDPSFERLRPDLAADGDHGRLAVPRAGHAQRHRPHAHGGRDHLLRHDRDLARLDADDRRGRARAPRRHGRPRAPARRGQDRRPRERPPRRARPSRASCAPAATR